MNTNFNGKRALIVLLFSILFVPVVISQNIYNSPEEGLRRAVELYNKGLYVSAEAELEKILKGNISDSGINLAEVKAYKTLCSIELRRPNLDGIVSEFIAKYPYSSSLNKVYLKYASVYFDNKDYIKAFEILSRIKKSEIPEVDITDYSFKMGYCNLRVGKLENALKEFAEIIYRPVNSYTAPSQYYTAYIHYIRKDFKQAIEKFKQLVTDKRFSTLSRYYILESNFMLENYKYVVENGEDLYNIMEKEYKAKTARMMSESFFALKRTDEAKFYFEKYSLYSGALSRKDIYYSGMIAYTLRNYLLAVESLQKLLNVDDSLTQNAQYHLANSFVQLKNKQKALELFKAAAESRFDASIKEDAMFNYAKLAFDLYADISFFEKYSRDYTPSESKSNEIKTYMATSFISRQDYKAAVEVLNQIKNLNENQNKLLQRSSLLRGLQLVEISAFREAVPYFEKVIETGRYNEYLAGLAQYWLAESHYRNNQFALSAELNESLLSKPGIFRTSTEFKLVNFNLGYSYLRLGNYPLAQQQFEKFLTSGNNSADFLSEGAMRLGDCLFMQKKYPEAVDAYSKVSQSNLNIYLYSVLQKGIALGLTGNDAAKISLLKDALLQNPKADLYSELQYELGRTLVQAGDNTGATVSFSDIIENHKGSSFYGKSLLEMGMISINKHDVNSSIEFYKRIIQELPQSAEAQDALTGLENVYQEADRSDEFMAYLEKTGLTSAKSASEKENLAYNTAERQYINGKYVNAITSLKKYITDYPLGSKLANAYFYLGESLNKSGKFEEALDSYLKVMEMGEGSFTELATLNYARNSYKLENYKQAYKAYASLDNIAKIDNNKVEAKLGKVNSLFMDKQYKEAVNEAVNLNSASLDEDRKTRLKFVIAKSRFMTGERSTAVNSLKELAKNHASVEGAESNYLLILNSFENGNFKEVENMVFAFSDTKTPQKYWLARCYVVLGDSYAEREEWEQAKATFNSILESYKPAGTGDDIAGLIKTRLNNIKTK